MCVVWLVEFEWTDVMCDDVCLWTKCAAASSDAQEHAQTAENNGSANGIRSYGEPNEKPCVFTDSDVQLLPHRTKIVFHMHPDRKLLFY